MNQKDENIKIAHELKSEVKHRLICSNDIIPRTRLPKLDVFLIPHYQSIFGHELIQLYVKHAHFTRTIREMIKHQASTFVTKAIQSTISLAVASYGVGECQEIATFCYGKLIEKNFRDIQFIGLSSEKCDDRQIPYMHCLILIGNDNHQVQTPCKLSVLNQLPEHIILLDAYLDYVGPANCYLKDQHAYIEEFNFNKIIVNDRPTSLHQENAKYIEENINKLKTKIEYEHFYRNFLNLSLSCFSADSLLPCHETALINCLNQASDLKFSWGHEDCKVTAYVEISDTKDLKIAESIQKKIAAGTFYQNKEQRFFVLHHINEQPGLGKRIETNFRIN